MAIEAIYIGQEFPERYGHRIETIQYKKGEYRIRFSDGFVAKWIFESEIDFNSKI